jgi:hypothetical protein
MDLSKALGYRDSYLFYQKNPQIRRLTCTEEDKLALDEKGLLPSILRNRPCSIVPARIIFKTFGNRIIIRGKPIRDDYFVGDQPEPDYGPPDYDLDEYDDDFGDLPMDVVESRLRRTTSQVGFGGGTPKFTAAKSSLANAITSSDEDPKVKRVAGSGIDTVLLKAATAAAEFNSRLRAQRKDKFLDIHTNIEQVPRATQPIGIKVEKDASIQEKSFQVETTTGEVAVEQDPNWLEVQNGHENDKFPIALLPGQFQGKLSV